MMLTKLEKEPSSMNRNDTAEIAEFLSHTNFMKNYENPLNKQTLNENERLELYKYGTYKVVPRGQKVYKRGEEGNKMYFIIKGEVAVTFPTSVAKERNAVPGANFVDI